MSADRQPAPSERALCAWTGRPAPVATRTGRWHRQCLCPTCAARCWYWTFEPPYERPCGTCPSCRALGRTAPRDDTWPPAWLGPSWAPGVVAYIPVGAVIRLSDPGRGYLRTALLVRTLTDAVVRGVTTSDRYRRE